MRPHRSPLRRRATRAAVVAVALVAATCVQISATGPAGAGGSAPLVNDGIGVRIDETALIGPVLDGVAAALDPDIEDLLATGAALNNGVPGSDEILVGVDVGLDLEVLAPGLQWTDGAFAFEATLSDLTLSYVFAGLGCTTTVSTTAVTATVDAAVAPANLPDLPFDVPDGDSLWSATPSVSSSDEACESLVSPTEVEKWWTDFADPTLPGSAAAEIEDAVEAAVLGLVDEMWVTHVMNLVDTMAMFGLTIDRLETDDHGLIVTIDTDATAGLEIPGLGGPYDVSTAADAGVTSDLDALLADRIGDKGPREVIVSIHPNVLNQLFLAYTDALNGVIGQYPVAGSIIEPMILPPAHWNSYNDNDWTFRVTLLTPPEVHPDPWTDVPELELPSVRVGFANPFPNTPVATFTGSMPNIPIATVGAWIASYDASGAAFWGTRTQANAHAAQLPEQPTSAIQPYVVAGWNPFGVEVASTAPHLSPGSGYGGITVDLCTGCGRSTGDQRYTETFEVLG